MDTLALLAMFGFCDYSPLVIDPNVCINELTQCKMDDAYTMRECIIEYKEYLIVGLEQKE